MKPFINVKSTKQVLCHDNQVSGPGASKLINNSFMIAIQNYVALKYFTNKYQLLFIC